MSTHPHTHTLTHTDKGNEGAFTGLGEKTELMLVLGCYRLEGLPFAARCTLRASGCSSEYRLVVDAYL